MSRLREITRLGQAIWIDDLNRRLLADGGLARLIAEDGLSGVTSNPTIFAKAVADSERYDASLRRIAAEVNDPREVFLRLACEDVRDAADVLRPVFERTDGRDGFVSFELPPELAHNVEGSIAEAQRFRAEIDRPNVLIKVPGTQEGVEAFEELTALGESINVTLLFAIDRYAEIAHAYVRGLERRAAAGEPIDGIASVASFFVSRVDTKIDAQLEERGHPELRGIAAIANARLAYERFRSIFCGERWEALRGRGARVQRPLWASTSTKNPDYPDTLYVDALIGPDTVNTMPEPTLAAARDHARVKVAITRDVEGAADALEAVAEVGVPVQDIVCRQLVSEGVDAFADSFNAAVQTVGEKLTELAPHGD